MKLVLYNDFQPGILKGDTVVDTESAVGHLRGDSPQELMQNIISNFDSLRPALERLEQEGKGVPASSVRLRPPLPCPPRLVCMAGNYMENGTRAEAGPLAAFNKASSSIIGDGDTVVLPDAPATVFEHEAELGIVIGKRASGIKAEEAYDHIFGYMNFIDVSCRGAGPPGSDAFYIGKSWDTFGPIGPALITADEVADPQNLSIKLWVQGELRQDYNTNDMGHSIPKTVEWITWITTLEPGDVIACGTNHRGLGPLQDGDKVEIEVADFGKLTVNVTDALKRSWVRETHAQKEAREAAEKPGG